jgi:hypothetical protein
MEVIKMKFLTIQKNNNGTIGIKDSIHNEYTLYFGYTEKQAIQQHRKEYNLQRLHFTKIYL